MTDEELYRMIYQGAGATPGSPEWLQEEKGREWLEPGGSRGGGGLTPEEMAARWRIMQQENERARARTMNEPPNLAGGGSGTFFNKQLWDRIQSGYGKTLSPEALGPDWSKFDDTIMAGGGAQSAGARQLYDRFMPAMQGAPMHAQTMTPNASPYLYPRMVSTGGTPPPRPYSSREIDPGIWSPGNQPFLNVDPRMGTTEADLMRGYRNPAQNIYDPAEMRRAIEGINAVSGPAPGSNPFAAITTAASGAGAGVGAPGGPTGAAAGYLGEGTPSLPPPMLEPTPPAGGTPDYTSVFRNAPWNLTTPAAPTGQEFLQNLNAELPEQGGTNVAWTEPTPMDQWDARIPGGVNVPTGEGANVAPDPFNALLQTYLNDTSGYLASSGRGPIPTINNAMPLPQGGAAPPYMSTWQDYTQAYLSGPGTTEPNLPDFSGGGGPTATATAGAAAAAPGEETPGYVPYQPYNIAPNPWDDPYASLNLPAGEQPPDYASTFGGLPSEGLEPGLPGVEGEIPTAPGEEPAVAPAQPVDDQGQPLSNVPAPVFAAIPGDQGPLYYTAPDGSVWDKAGNMIKAAAGTIGTTAANIGGKIADVFGDLSTSTPFNTPPGYIPGMFGGVNPFVGGAFWSPAGGSIGGPLGTGSHGNLGTWWDRLVNAAYRRGDPTVGFGNVNPITEYASMFSPGVSRAGAPSWATIAPYFGGGGGFTGDVGVTTAAGGGRGVLPPPPTRGDIRDATRAIGGPGGHPLSGAP